MITSIILSIVVQANYASAFISDSLLPKDKFKLVDDRRSLVVLRRIADNAQLVIRFGDSTPEALANDIGYQMGPRYTDDLPKSGYPIGKKDRNHILYCPGRMLDIHAKNDWESVHLSLTCNMTRRRENGRTIKEYFKADFSNDHEWAEYLVRDCLSNFAVRRMGNIESITISSKAVSSFVMAKSNVRYVDLASWGTASGATVNRNDAARRVSVSGSRRSAIMTLASARVKCNGKWEVMPDVMVSYRGKVWVPLKFLESLD